MLGLLHLLHAAPAHQAQPDQIYRECVADRLGWYKEGASISGYLMVSGEWPLCLLGIRTGLLAGNGGGCRAPLLLAKVRGSSCSRRARTNSWLCLGATPA